MFDGYHVLHTFYVSLILVFISYHKKCMHIYTYIMHKNNYVYILPIHHICNVSCALEPCPICVWLLEIPKTVQLATWGVRKVFQVCCTHISVPQVFDIYKSSGILDFGCVYKWALFFVIISVFINHLQFDTCFSACAVHLHAL